jgi:hypothetical protein
MRTTITIDGYDQIFDIDTPAAAGAALGDRIRLALSGARLFPSDAGVVLGEGDGSDLKGAPSSLARGEPPPHRRSSRGRGRRTGFVTRSRRGFA